MCNQYKEDLIMKVSLAVGYMNGAGELPCKVEELEEIATEIVQILERESQLDKSAQINLIFQELKRIKKERDI